MSINQERVDQINSLVVGWMVPIMKRTDPYTGDVLNGLGPEDFARVQAGYGCPKCLAMFKTYLVKCPACLYMRDVEKDVEATPDLWASHLKARHSHDTPYTRPVSADEFLAEVARDTDVERFTA